MFKGVAALPVRLLKTERYHFGMVPPSEPINLKLKAAILAWFLPVELTDTYMYSMYAS